MREPNGTEARAEGKFDSGGKIFSDAELMQLEFEPIQWAVQGIVPEGCTLFAGRPKTGKSWLTLNLCLAVAAGGVALSQIPVSSGDVLYLALEDGLRRLQSRLQKVLQATQTPTPGRLNLTTAWPRTNAGGIDEIGLWLDGHPEARLVVIDTLAKVRARRTNQTGIYEEDYAAIRTFNPLPFSDR